MPAKVKRKIIGDRGLVSLPKAYRDYHQIEKGDEVVVLYDNFLVITPPNIVITEEKAQTLKKLLE